jgi:hypothetical protein
MMTDNQTGDDAGAALAAPAAPDASGGNTCTVPVDLLPNAKVGDEFKVQSIADGNVTLSCEAADDESGEDWGKGLTQAAAPGEEGM